MEPKVGSETSDKAVFDSEFSESSVRKTKVIRKCVPRKKMTKIVHNFVVHYRKPNGEHGVMTHRKIV